jgi:hypothetical protein
MYLFSSEYEGDSTIVAITVFVLAIFTLYNPLPSGFTSPTLFEGVSNGKRLEWCVIPSFVGVEGMPEYGGDPS